MEENDCPACSSRDVRDDGVCATCGFDVRKYAILSKQYQSAMLYQHLHPDEEVIESKKVGVSPFVTPKSAHDNAEVKGCGKSVARSNEECMTDIVSELHELGKKIDQCTVAAAGGPSFWGRFFSTFFAVVLGLIVFGYVAKFIGCWINVETESSIDRKVRAEYDFIKSSGVKMPSY